MPNLDRDEETRRLERAFEALPKSRHWTTKAHEHLGQDGLTRAIIAETLETPTDVEIQPVRRNVVRTAFYRYYPAGSGHIANAGHAEGGAWFRVVLESDGSLCTAFRDFYTEPIGGRERWRTPQTMSNI